MEEKQVKHFSFRQMHRISTGFRRPNGAKGKYSLLCCANIYGLVFVGGDKSVAMFHTVMLHKVDAEDSQDHKEAVPIDQLQPVMVTLPGQPCHVGISADELTLSVCLRGSTPSCLLFDTRSFCGPNSQPKPFVTVDLSGGTGGQMEVTSFSWNPGQPESFAVCMSDGSVSMWVNQGTTVNCTAKNQLCNASSVCWSPKGKQLAVGHKDGTLSQFSQTMDLKRKYPAPELNEPHEATGLFWISTYQFAVVYVPTNQPSSEDEGLPPLPHFEIVTVTKKKSAPDEIGFVDFEDIYYGDGYNESNFLFSFLSTWNILITCSSNASESMVVSKSPGSEVAWEKWNLEDEGRAELPLDGTDDTFPCGMCLDLTSVIPVPMGENQQIPPSPLFMLLSDRGLLMPYTVVNAEPLPGTTHDFVKPPQPLVKTGERVTTTTMPPPSSIPSSVAPQALGSMKLGSVMKPALVTSSVLSQAHLQSTTVGRSLSVEKTTASSSPFSIGGSLPNLMSNKPPMQMTFPSLAREGQKATFSLGGNFVPPSNITPPRAPFNHPLLSSTPISAAASSAPPPFSAATSTVVNTAMPPPTGRINISSVPSSTIPSSLQMAPPKLIQAPPPSIVQATPPYIVQGAPPTLVQAAPPTVTPPKSVQVAPPKLVQVAPPPSSAVPASSLHKFMTSQAMPTKPSAPSPTFSVTSSVEEENVEMKLQAAIEQEIDEFSERLQDHRDDIREEFGIGYDDTLDDSLCAIGGDEDQRQLVEGQEEMSTNIKSLMEQTKELTNASEALLDEVLQARSLYEEASHSVRMHKSGHYRDYVRMKPLPPLLQSLLEEARVNYVRTESRVRELSAQIDADIERRKQTEAIRVGGAKPLLCVPSQHNIYTTLKNNRRISRLQAGNIDDLVERMKEVSILPRAWKLHSPITTSELSSTSQSPRASNELLQNMDSYTSPIRQIPERRRKTALFKQVSPDRLSQLQKLLKTEVKTTAMQRVPMVTSFMIAKSPSTSTRSSTPVASDDEVCFNVAQKKEQLGVTFDKQLGQDDSSVNQPLQDSPPVLYGTPQLNQGIPPFNQSTAQATPFVSQLPVQQLPPYSQASPSVQPNQSVFPTSQSSQGPPASQSLQGILTSQSFPPMNQSLQSLFSSKTSQEYPPASQSSQGFSQTPLGFPPLSQPSHGSSPFTLLSSLTTHSENAPFPTFTSAGFSSQPFSLHNTAPPPPPLPQEHHGTSPPTATTKTPAEMAADAALKRQDSVVVTTTLQNTTTISEVIKAPVVVITASEMPPSSLFFIAKSQDGKTVTESSVVTSDASRFAAPERSNSLPSNVKFPFSSQTTTGMKLPFSTSGAQTPLAFGLTANKVGTTSDPLTNPELGIASASKAASNLQFSVVTTATANSVPSLQTTTTTGSDSSTESSNVHVTQPLDEAEETTEESDQSDTEHDATLTDTTTAHTVTTASLPISATAATTIALPDLSKATVSIVSTTSAVSVSTPAAVSSVVSAAGGAPPPTSRMAMPTFLASSTVTTAPVSATASPVSLTAATLQSSAPLTVTFATEASTAPSLQTSNTKFVTSEVPASTTAGQFSLTVASSSGADSAAHSSLLKVPPNDKLTESDEESDLCDNVIDKVSSQSSIMTDDLNVVDDVSEGEMEPNVKENQHQLSSGFISLFGGSKPVNPTPSGNPFSSTGNISDTNSSKSTLFSAHTPSVGSGSVLAPPRFAQNSGSPANQGSSPIFGMGVNQIGGLGVSQTGMGVGQTGMGVGQTGMGVGQTGMGVGQTGMGVGQTGMGVGQTGMGTGLGIGSGQTGAGLGLKFGSIPSFAGQAQFGSRPMMGSSTAARVFGSSMESGEASFGSLAAGSGQNSLGGGGQGFAGLGSTQGFGGQGIPSSSTGNKHSFSSWR